MPRFIYTLRETKADWVEHLYHTDVPVRGGIAESDDPLVIENLLYRGFKMVEELESDCFHGIPYAEECRECAAGSADAVVE